MRLIDADAIIYYESIDPDTLEGTGHFFAPRELINALPTIEERNKGSWTDDNACPFCGFQPWYERDIHTLSYCPNCGADLRGEDDDIPIEYFENGGI